jgi:hypothetical protein
MMRWYFSKKGLHISRKSRFLIVGITISSSSQRRGFGIVAYVRWGSTREVVEEVCLGIEMKGVKRHCGSFSL